MHNQVYYSRFCISVSGILYRGRGWIAKRDTVNQEHVQRDVTHSVFSSSEMFFTPLHRHACTHYQAQYTRSSRQRGGKKERLKTEVVWRGQGQLVVGSLRQGASHPQAQARSDSAASQPPDGPMPFGPLLLL